MIVQIEVTGEDIAKGVIGECRACPVALAVNRALSLHVDIANGASVSNEHIDIRFDWCCIARIPTPAIAAEFIHQFDDNAGPHPFAFPLDIPDSAWAKLQAAKEPQ